MSAHPDVVSTAQPHEVLMQVGPELKAELKALCDMVWHLSFLVDYGRTHDISEEITKLRRDAALMGKRLS